MKNLKLKGLKYNKGKYELFNDRFVFFPPQLINILSSIYGEGVKSLLVWLGKKAGWICVQNWEENLRPKNLKDLADQFCNTLSNQGWGKFELEDVSEEKIIIKLKYNISENLENASKYICYFITGILSGFGEFALYKVNVTEKQCSLDGDEFENCLFEINKIS